MLGLSKMMRTLAAISLLLESATAIYPITGIQDSGIQSRLEIRVLAQNQTQWNLFLLSLIQFQAINQTQLLSYYQIAGIHGQPWIPWDGVAGINPTVGYCAHASNLFSPWHRPYVVLVEEQIHYIGLTIAAQFPAGPIRNSYEEAALKLRLPYWDWAQVPPNGGAPYFPTVVTSPTTVVSFPNGTTATVPNPLYSYRFNPLVPSDFGNTPPYSIWPTTLRWPTNQTPTARYNTFSNKGSGNGGYGNLESVHDQIHVFIGGQTEGHMSDPRVAAFDPVFWLHHANIDRLLMIWQTVYPYTYVDPFAQQFPTYTIPVNSIQNATSPLTPFHSNANGAFWNSSALQGTTLFGYTYPELADLPNNATLIARINALYGGTPLDTSNSTGTNSSGITAPDSPVPHDYLVSISLPFTALNASYAVGVFLGGVTEPLHWSTDPNFVGLHATLAPPAGSDSDLLIHGIVHLTQALLTKFETGELDGLEEENIVEYLKANLHWRILSGGVAIPRENVLGLLVQAQSIEVLPAESDGEFSRWVGDFTSYDDVVDE